MVLALLACSGVNFDCASMQEIKKVLALGVDPSRIVYAHPVKTIKYLQFARLSGVTKMTFDSLDELYKVGPLKIFRKTDPRLIPNGSGILDLWSVDYQDFT